MRVLIFGAGAIGTIYGYFLAKAGNEVIHYVRPDREAQIGGGINVSILDGRDEKNVRRIQDLYAIQTVTNLTADQDYDIILVSIKHGALEGALQVLKDSGTQGEIIFFNGLWKDYCSIDPYIARGRYLWGYPVAGGNIDYANKRLEGALLDHVVLNEIDGKTTERLAKIERLFNEAGIKVEKPRNVLHWIWVHMAINAGVISTCLKAGSAGAFMNSVKALKEGILTMREGLRIVEARGVCMDDFRDEVRMYYYPATLSSVLFKMYFRKNELSRKIMEMHNNLDDLYEICNDVYQMAQELKIDTPLLTQKEEYFLNKQCS